MHKRISSLNQKQQNTIPELQYVISIIRLQNWHWRRHHGEEDNDVNSQYNDSLMLCLLLDSGKNMMVVKIVLIDLTNRRHGVNIQRRSDNTYTESLVNYDLDEWRWEWLLSLPDTYKQGCWRKFVRRFLTNRRLSSFLSYKFLLFYSTVPDSVVTDISSHNIHGDIRLDRLERTYSGFQVYLAARRVFLWAPRSY